MSNKPRIAVVIPTRGLVVDKCIESVFDNLSEASVSYKGFIVSELGIPACFNEGVRRALLWKPDYVWMVEEDVITPKLGLDNLLRLDADVGIIDYPMKNGYGTVAYYNGKAMWCGTGCTLIKRHVFDRLAKPYFRTDILYNIHNDGTFTQHYVDGMQRYGGHDIHFGLMVNKAGMTIKAVPSCTAVHKKLVELGKPGTNNGQHVFKEYSGISRGNRLKQNPLDAIDNNKDTTYIEYISL